jgi:ribosomal protein S18 acetylase RimI-like enzyme
MTVTIRKAVPTDAATIAAFQLAMAQETEGKQLELEVVKPAVDEVFANPNRGFYLVGEIDGDVAGSLMVTYEWSDWRNSNLWYIQSVYVQKQYRGCGVFKNLYQMVIDLARSQKAAYVRLYVETDNERAQKVYESLGMKRLPYYMYDIKID